MIVEDGTGVVGANSFATIAELQAYSDDRNIDISSYSNEELEAALIVASYDFINFNYHFPGTLLNEDQGMCIPTDEVPIDTTIKNSACAAAILQLQGRLFVDPADIDVNGGIKSTSDSVGTLNTEIVYQDGGGYRTTYPTTSIDKMLSKYVTGGGYAPATAKRW